MTDKPPTFQQVRLAHGISIEMLAKDAGVEQRAVVMLDTMNIGEPSIIDELLTALSRLVGIEYRRDLLNIGGFTFSLRPPYDSLFMALIEETITETSL